MDDVLLLCSFSLLLCVALNISLTWYQFLCYLLVLWYHPARGSHECKHRWRREWFTELIITCFV